MHVFTHESIAVGADRPTHQPVERLAALRAIPGLLVIRPGDANETAVAWRVALETRDRTVVLILSRQALPTQDRRRYAPADGLRCGAYVPLEARGPTPQLILIASGSELGLIFTAADRLHAQGIAVRCGSMPSWELFEAQTLADQRRVLPPSVGAKLAVEGGVAQGWHRYVGPGGGVLSLETFGVSAPAHDVQTRYGFTVDEVCRRAMELMR